MRNALGQRHLLVDASLRGTQNGVIEAYQRIKKSPRTGERIKNDVWDHVDDGVRYMCNHLLGDSGFAPEVKH